MGLRKPLQTIGNFTAAANETGGGSVAGGIAYTVTIPQDSVSLVVKFTASVVGGYSATLQTTDDAGTTWYDVARTSIVSNANNALATWCMGQVNGGGVATSQNNFPTNSIMSVGIRSTAASTLGANQVSGLPLLSDRARVFVRITGDITDAAANTYVAQVKVNSESGTA